MHALLWRQGLAQALRTVRANTLQAAEEIPESKLDFSPAPVWRTIRQLLTHIAFGDSFMHFQKRASHIV